MFNELLVDTEEVYIAPDELAVKTGNPTKVHQPSPVGSGDRIVPKMIDADTIAKTRKLLDGAIVLAWKDAKSNHRPPAFTRAQWTWQLAGAYHLTHSYPPLIKEAAWRFEKMGCQNLSQWALQKARDEQGHDRLALLDIQSIGYKAEAVVKTLLIPPNAVDLVNYLTQTAQVSDPIGCVGYSYAMERIATGIKEKHIQSVEALLPQGIHATRCLRTHSSLGADVKHVEETVEVIARLVPEERLRVAIACYETALLYFNLTEKDYISEEELQNVLRPLESPTHLQSRDEIYSHDNR